MRFSFNLFGSAHYPAGSGFPLRRMTDFEWVWIEEGAVRWLCDGTTHPTPPGTVVLSQPGLQERYLWDPAGPTRHGYVHFSILDGADGLPPRSGWPRLAAMPAGDVMRPMLAHLLLLLRQRPPGWQELVQSANAHLLRTWIAGCIATRADGGSLLPQPLDRVVQLVTERWAGGVSTGPSLAAMARAAGVTPGHLCRLARRHFGCAPEEALRLLRLDRAAQLLAGTELGVGEVAALSGDLDPFHFSRSFRARHGVSPRAFRTSGARPRPLPPALAVLAARVGG